MAFFKGQFAPFPLLFAALTRHCARTNPFRIPAAFLFTAI
jgi:hypothetical protein